MKTESATPPADYPAAHSMDTTWFAVDRDGNVGLFHSHEQGSVPAPMGELADTERRILAGLLLDADHWELAGHADSDERWLSGRIVEMLVERDELVLPAGDPRAHIRLPDEAEEWDFALDCLFVLPGGSPVPEEFTPLYPAVVRADPTTVIHLPVLTRRAHAAVHESGLCLGCRWLPFGLDFAHHPCFVYGGLWDGGYEREGDPAGAPVHLDQLPPRVRQWLGQHRFRAVRFAETPTLDPTHHLPCHVYGQRELSTPPPREAK